ncbi:MAG: phage tail spike protein [Christensenellales bacterium]
MSYDQLDNIVKSYAPDKAAPQAALDSMSGNLSNPHPFAYRTNLTDLVTMEWKHKNGIEVLQDPEMGLIAQNGAQLIRDNYDLFVLENEQTDRGVAVQSGKNLLGVTSWVNMTEMVTRVIPLGKDLEGNTITLPEYSIDSPLINDYPLIMTLVLDSQAQVREASDTDPGMTLAEVQAKMREMAQERYEKGCDLPESELDIRLYPPWGHGRIQAIQRPAAAVPV